jgi:hypothetical protein
MTLSRLVWTCCICVSRPSTLLEGQRSRHGTYDLSALLARGFLAGRASVAPPSAGRPSCEPSSSLIAKLVEGMCRYERSTSTE